MRCDEGDLMNLLGAAALLFVAWLVSKWLVEDPDGDKVEQVIFSYMDLGTFGGENYYFKSTKPEDEDVVYLVCVGWASFLPFSTHVQMVRGSLSVLNNFTDKRYVFPKEAFSRLDISIVESSETCGETGLPVDHCFHCGNMNQNHNASTCVYGCKSVKEKAVDHASVQ